MRRPLIWASLAAALSAAAAAHAGDGPTTYIYVDDDAPAGGDGMSWQTAFRDLQDALDAARCADPVEIRVAGGVYVPSGAEGTPRDRFLVDALRGGCGVRLDGIAPFDDAIPSIYADESTRSWTNLSHIVFSIRGAFAGLARPATPDLQDPAEFVSILSGDRDGDDQPGFDNRRDNCARVLEIHAALGEATLMVEHFEISGAGGEWDNTEAGAGVFIAGSSGGVSLNNCRILYNTAAQYGGGALVAGGSITQFYRCEFRGNEADYGGAIRTHSFTRIQYCVFSHNRASLGGAISNLNGTFCKASIFAENSATWKGGAIDGNTYAYDCLFVGNTSNADGGAVSGSTADFQGCTFIQSNAPQTDVSNDEWASFRNCIVVTSSSAPIIRAGDISFSTSMVDNDQTAFEVDGGQLYWSGSFVAPPRFLDPVGPDGDAANWEDNDYRPGPGSAAIDAAESDSGCYNYFDAANRSRYIDAFNYTDVGESCHLHRPVKDLGPYEAPADTPRLCDADWNADESVDVQDALAFLGDLASSQLGADLNRDNLWDFFDLQLFLIDFARGCP